MRVGLGTNKHAPRGLLLLHLLLAALLLLLLLPTMARAADAVHEEELAVDANGADFLSQVHGDKQDAATEHLAVRLLSEMSSEVERMSSSAYAQLFRHDETENDGHEEHQRKASSPRMLGESCWCWLWLRLEP